MRLNTGRIPWIWPILPQAGRASLLFSGKFAVLHRVPAGDQVGHEIGERRLGEGDERQRPGHFDGGKPEPRRQQAAPREKEKIRVILPSPIQPVNEPASTASTHAVMPAPVVAAAKGSMGGAAIAAQRLSQAGLGAAARKLDAAAVVAFQHGLNYALAAAAGVAAAGFVMVVFLLPARPGADGTQPGPASAEPESVQALP